jgi:hypothetical protein
MGSGARPRLHVRQRSGTRYGAAGDDQWPHEHSTDRASCGNERLRRFGTGEIWDVEWVPGRAMEAVLTVEIEGQVRRQVFRVRGDQD